MRKSAKYNTSPFQVMFGIEGRSVQDDILFQELDNTPLGNENHPAGEVDIEPREAPSMAVALWRAERKASPGDYSSNPSFEVGETVALLTPSYKRLSPLVPKRIGPFVAISVLAPGVYTG